MAQRDQADASKPDGKGQKRQSIGADAKARELATQEIEPGVKPAAKGSIQHRPIPPRRLLTAAPALQPQNAGAAAVRPGRDRLAAG